MCCPCNKVIKSDTKCFLALGRLHKGKLYDILQAMAPTNVETVHQTSLFHIESNLDRFGLLSPTHGQRSQQQSGQITLQSVLISKPEFLKAKHRTEIRKIEIRRPMVVEALSARTSIQPSRAMCISEKAPRILPVHRSLLALVEEKQTVVRDQLFSQKPPDSRL